MTLDKFIGNADVVKALKGMLAAGRIPHAMLFYENDGCGAISLVLSFLSDLYSDENRVLKMLHPDIRYVYPVSNGSKVKEKVENLKAELFLDYWRKLISENPYALENEVSSAFGVESKKVEINNAQARGVLENIYLTSIEGGYKAVVIYLPEKMNVTAANRLLKAIEEPPEKTLFLMITHSPEKVLQTISSRCQSFRLLPYSKTEIEDILVQRFGKDRKDAAEAASIAGGSVGVAVESFSEQEDRKEQYAIFQSLINAFVAKDLSAALQCGEMLAALSSREKQKAFCKFVGESLRKIFLIQQNLNQLVELPQEEGDFLRKTASKCRKSFPRQALSCLDRAQMLIDRNVSQKILFCDLVGRMYLSF